MKTLTTVMLIILALAVTTGYGQMMTRTDAIWARTVPANAITVDGRMTEAAWAQAESVSIGYGQTPLIPGSGYRNEGGVEPSDPTRATFKFLVSGNVLYIGVMCKDSSIGGGLFNRFDGLLMNFRNHASASRPAPPFEYFYGWVAEPWADSTLDSGNVEPGFFGGAGKDTARWTAKTVVHGAANADTTAGGQPAYDTSWVTELKINLDILGYNVAQAEGDIVEFNVSVYDADWQWGADIARFSGNRTWLQGPWGNASAYNAMRVHARPSVTTTSGALPVIAADVIIPNGANFATPSINGNLNDTVWTKIRGVDVRFNDDNLRASYPGIGPYRSGQFQPTLDTIKATVTDPADLTIKWFFKGDTLFLGADVRDQDVFGSNANSIDRWDGVQFMLTDRAAIDSQERVGLRREFALHFDSLGAVVPTGYLQFLIDSLQAGGFSMALKPGTTISNFNDVDSGFQAEIWIDLKALGYPAGRGDGIVFISSVIYDYDAFANPVDNYGNRAWFFRENGFNDAPAWGYLDPATLVTAVRDQAGLTPAQFSLIGNYPNPFNPGTKIQFVMAVPGEVTLRVYDMLGRLVTIQALGLKEAGRHEVAFNAGNLSSGVYMYQIQMSNAATRKLLTSETRRMVLIK